MGPLVYYCRWRGAKLRLLGRDDRFVWGNLVFTGENGDRLSPFRFDMKSRKLLLDENEDSTWLQLDELGVVVPSVD